MIMERITGIVLKKLRYRYKRFFKVRSTLKITKEYVNLNQDEVHESIHKLLQSDKPFLVARFGSEELKWYVNFKQLTQNFFTRAYNYITIKTDFWRYKDRIINSVVVNPISEKSTHFFINKFDMAIPEIDILGSWLKLEGDRSVKMKCTKFAFLPDLDPFFVDNPWTLSLKGKKVLIIHPMVDDIKLQYEKRDLLFKAPILPECELKFIQAAFFDDPNFSGCEDIYAYYLRELQKCDFDVAIIGCGPLGLPIGAEIKRMGKQAIHLGGPTQLLFGIKGNRWMSKDYLDGVYNKLFNEHWIFPSKKPSWGNKLEDSCYWKKD